MDRTAPAEGDAVRSLAYMQELTAELRGAAILAGDGRVLASTGEPSEWEAAAARLFDMAEGAAAETLDHVHVATEGGEVFGVRESGLLMVAVTGRFPLASLTVFDMRTVLRDLAGAGSAVAPS
jgi:hypothetical protein